MSRLQEMESSIKKSTAFGLGLYLGPFTYLLVPEWTLKQVSDIQKLADVLPILVVPVAMGIAGYLVIGDIHNLLDRRFFGARRNVDDYISDRITTPCRDALCPRAVRQGIVAGEETRIMDLFYTFIPGDDTERERAFAYWTNYFIATNLSALAFAAAIIAVGIATTVPLPATGQRLAFGAIALVAPALANALRLTRRRRLYGPARAQTTRILTKHQDELKKLLPQYRIYEAETSCQDANKCPLLGRS